MPAYDYRCTDCDKVFEIVRPMGPASPVECPACGAKSKRLFSPVGVSFKGSGFHNTDYRPKPPAEGDAPSSCPAKSESSEKCASCPAAAAE